MAFHGVPHYAQEQAKASCINVGTAARCCSQRRRLGVACGSESFPTEPPPFAAMLVFFHDSTAIQRCMLLNSGYQRVVCAYVCPMPACGMRTAQLLVADEMRSVITCPSWLRRLALRSRSKWYHSLEELVACRGRHGQMPSHTGKRPFGTPLGADGSSERGAGRRECCTPLAPAS